MPKNLIEANKFKQTVMNNNNDVEIKIFPLFHKKWFVPKHNI
jgi:hypothetical protein